MLFHQPALSLKPDDEVLLQRAPLVRVISQISFPEVLKVENAEVVAPFQELIRKQYPSLRRDKISEISFAANTQSAGDRTVWNFSDEAEVWTITLTSASVTLSTKKYTDRHDFVRRAKFMIESVKSCIDPDLANKIGVRYINHVAGDDFQSLKGKFSQTLDCFSKTPFIHHCVHSITDASIAVSQEENLLMKYGYLPPHATTDPVAYQAAASNSWLLDLDMSSSSVRKFSTDDLITKVEEYSRHIYAVFRFTVTPDLLDFFRGQRS